MTCPLLTVVPPGLSLIEFNGRAIFQFSNCPGPLETQTLLGVNSPAEGAMASAPPAATCSHQLLSEERSDG